MLAADWQIRTLNPSQGMQQAGVTLSLAGSWMRTCPVSGKAERFYIHAFVPARAAGRCDAAPAVERMRTGWPSGKARAATCALRVCQRVRQADVTLCQADELDARDLALLAGQNP